MLAPRGDVAGDPQQTKGKASLARLHAALGVALGGYVVFHVWQQWPVLLGRDAWLDRAMHAALPQALKLVLAAVVIAHVLLGALRLRASAHPADTAIDAGLRRVQLFFGALTLLFLAIHLPLVRWTPGPASTVLDVHERLTHELGRPGMMAAHLVGLTAVCAHLGLGLGRGAVSLGLVSQPRWLYYVGGLLAGILLLCWLQVLAVYAIGEPLIPALAPLP